jgi:hypothetical protein
MSVAPELLKQLLGFSFTTVFSSLLGKQALYYFFLLFGVSSPEEFVDCAVAFHLFNLL